MVELGKAYLELGDPNLALKQFNQAMAIAPQLPEPRQQAGYANYLLKNYQGAIALFQGALTFDQANPLIYKRMGLAYRALGDNAGAAQAFRKYLEMEPDAPDKAEFERYL
jgi:tetratricopeptide (TPR) repeat protein